MSTMNISLPESLKAFVDERVDEGHYGTSSEYVRELIRSDQARVQLRRLLLDGLESEPGPKVDRSYWAGLRRRAGRQTSK